MTKAHRTVATLALIGVALATVIAVWQVQKPPSSDPPLDQATRERVTRAIVSCLDAIKRQSARPSGCGTFVATVCGEVTAIGAPAIPALIQRAREARDDREARSAVRLVSEIACRRFSGKTPQESLSQAERWWKGARGQRRDDWIILGLAGRKGYDSDLARNALRLIRDPAMATPLLSTIEYTSVQVGADILQRVWFGFHDRKALDFARQSLRPARFDEAYSALAFVERGKVSELYPTIVGVLEDYLAHPARATPLPNASYVRNPSRAVREAWVFMEAIRICGNCQISAAIPSIERAALSRRVAGDDTLIVRTLARLEGEAYAPRLVELLRSPDPAVRKAAAEGLFWAARADVDIPAMVAAFGDPEPSVRHSLAISLGAVAQRTHARGAVASVVDALLTELARPDFDGTVGPTDALEWIADHVFPGTRKPYQRELLPPSTVPGRPYAVWQPHMLAYWCEWAGRVLPEVSMKACGQDGYQVSQPRRTRQNRGSRDGSGTALPE